MISVVWSDLSRPEGLSGLDVDVWSDGASERRRSAPASLHAAGLFSSLSGALVEQYRKRMSRCWPLATLTVNLPDLLEQPWAGEPQTHQSVSMYSSLTLCAVCNIDCADGFMKSIWWSFTMYGSVSAPGQGISRSLWPYFSQFWGKKNGIEIFFNCVKSELVEKMSESEMWEIQTELQDEKSELWGKKLNCEKVWIARKNVIVSYKVRIARYEVRIVIKFYLKKKSLNCKIWSRNCKKKCRIVRKKSELWGKNRIAEEDRTVRKKIELSHNSNLSLQSQNCKIWTKNCNKKM